MSNFSISKRPIIICIEGNIGSGKSTLIQMLEKAWGKSNFVYLREPVSQWELVSDFSEENILQKFYKNPSKYAYTFQTLVYLTFYNQLKTAVENSNEDTVIICERSMDSCENVFARMLYKDGHIDVVEYQILKMFYSQFKPIPIDAIIYMDIDIFTCKMRVNKRSRLGEEKIQIGYLDKCEKQYGEWLHSIHDKMIIESIKKDDKEDIIISSMEVLIEKIRKGRKINTHLVNINSDKFHCCNCNLNMMFINNSEKHYIYIPNGIELCICSSCYKYLTTMV